MLLTLIIALSTHLLASAYAAPLLKAGWDQIQLSDGTKIPSIAFGTGSLGNGQQSVDKVGQAFSTGFTHIDTAQVDSLYITTKYSGVNGLPIHESIRNSVKYLGVDSVDLYLIHHPRLAMPDIPTVWRQMEKAKADGLTTSIGVSNFEIEHLEILLRHAKVRPVVNQISLNPYALPRQKSLMEYCARHGITIEAYSPLVPLTREPGGPLDEPLNEISLRLNASPEQVLLAWARAKGTVVVTSSSRKDRLQKYIEAGDLVLTKDDVAAIDNAAATRVKRDDTRQFIYRAVLIMLFAATILSICSWLGIDII
ncbi:Aldo/keto reductase [Trametopsis cervina]|nr:Aldo/keto reductase [Trametopsis cervina]